jgi:hypothetical protein
VVPLLERPPVAWIWVDLCLYPLSLSLSLARINCNTHREDNELLLHDIHNLRMTCLSPSPSPFSPCAITWVAWEEDELNAIVCMEEPYVCIYVDART